MSSAETLVKEAIRDAASRVNVDAHIDDAIIKANALAEITPDRPEERPGTTQLFRQSDTALAAMRRMMKHRARFYAERYAVDPPPSLHNAYLTYGTETTKNNRAETGFDPRKGHRESEGWIEAYRLGCTSSMQFNGRDDRLGEDVALLTPQLAALYRATSADMVVAPNQMSPDDSPDHAHAAVIALGAAVLLDDERRDVGKPITLLIPRPDPNYGLRVEQSARQLEAFDQWFVGHLALDYTARAEELAGISADASESQFVVSPKPTDDFVRLSGSHYMEPRDFASIESYGYGEKQSTYLVYQIGSLAAA